MINHSFNTLILIAIIISSRFPVPAIIKNHPGILGTVMISGNTRVDMHKTYKLMR